MILFMGRSDVSYASPTSIPATLYHVQWIDTQSSPPFCEFRFIYRSREVLISNGIIPPPMKKEIEEPPQSKKRKLTSKKRTSTKKIDPPPSSNTTMELPSAVKPRYSKKPKTTGSTTAKSHSKKDALSRTTEEESPISMVSTEPPASPLVDALQHRVRSLSHTFASSPPISPPLASQTQSDILRELQDLRVWSLYSVLMVGRSETS